MKECDEFFVADALRTNLRFCAEHNREIVVVDSFLQQYRGRPYHGIQHLRAMLEILTLERFDNYTQKIRFGADVFAILFHDIVYVAGSQTNEEESAEAFAKFASDHLFDPSVTSVVKYAIVSSMDAPPCSDDEYEQYEGERAVATLLHDLDFAILGASPYQYMKYCIGIREEYASVPDDVFTKGRANFLRGQLEKESVFCLQGFHQAYNDQAQKNVLGELSMLGG